MNVATTTRTVRVDREKLEALVIEALTVNSLVEALVGFVSPTPLTETLETLAMDVAADAGLAPSEFLGEDGNRPAPEWARLCDAGDEAASAYLSKLGSERWRGRDAD